MKENPLVDFAIRLGSCFDVALVVAYIDDRQRHQRRASERASESTFQFWMMDLCSGDLIRSTNLFIFHKQILNWCCWSIGKRTSEWASAQKSVRTLSMCVRHQFFWQRWLNYEITFVNSMLIYVNFVGWTQHIHTRIHEHRQRGRDGQGLENIFFLKNGLWRWMQPTTCCRHFDKSFEPIKSNTHGDAERQSICLVFIELTNFKRWKIFSF